MIDPSTLRAMVRLLDDPDLDVSLAVESRLMQEGESVIDELEALWLNNEFPEASRYIELVINKIQKRLLHQRFTNWFEQEQPDLIEGWVLVTQLQYPGVKLADVKRQLNDIKLDAWLLMGNVENDLDRIQILNHVFLNNTVFMAIQANITTPIILLLIEFWNEKQAIPLACRPYTYPWLNI